MTSELPRHLPITADTDWIQVRGARTHNLRNVDVDVPRDRLVVITGVSGSGKSSLAFDTIFAEGQRRYLECLSSHTRQFLHQLERPEVDSISGLAPTICVDQRVTAARVRSTLATTTEIYDYLRLLYARAGQAHCPDCRQPVAQQSVETIIARIMQLEAGRKAMILAPIVVARKGAHREVFEKICKAGFVRARVDGEIIDAAAPPDLPRTKAHSIDAIVDRIIVKPGIEARLRESIELALKHGEGACVISEQSGDKWLDRLYSTKYACPQCGTSFPSLEPRTFSFNSPYGACPKCRGLGRITDDADANEELWQRAVCPECSGDRIGRFARAVTLTGYSLPAVAACTVEDAARLFDDLLSRLAARKGEAQLREGGLSPEAATAAGAIVPEILSRLRFLERVGVGYLTLDRPTRTLSGGEFQRARLASCLGSALIGVCYVLDEPTIGLHPRDTRRLIDVFTDLRDRGNSVLVVEHDVDVMRAADWLIDLGPGAGSEGGLLVMTGSPRELASGTEASGSPRPGTFWRERGIGGEGENSIDSPTLRALRGVRPRVDALETPPLGLPQGLGGFCATPNSVADSSSAKAVEPLGQAQGRSVELNSPFIRLTGARIHNLRDVSVSIPLGVFVAVTGVSGSGKTSLITHSLVPAAKHGLRLRERAEIVGLRELGLPCESITGLDQLDRIVVVDQSPIGRSGRSNPATHSGLWDEVRRVFSKTKDARLRGFSAKRFSFLSPDGRCPTCRGQGTQRLEMNFLPDQFVTCPDCHGARFNAQTLHVRYRDKSVADVLKLRVDAAAEFFTNFPKLHATLEVMCSVGLGYLELGQPANTLSGGEAQRIKLATELAKGGSERVLYVLDEPTTGLHPADVERLNDLLHRLVERGHSVLVVEHNLDVIRAADWVIDLGPEGGALGGVIVATGTPSELAARPEISHTAAALAGCCMS